MDSSSASASGSLVSSSTRSSVSDPPNTRAPPQADPRPMARQPLPDPLWAPDACLRCGYSLGEVPDIATCPECGQRYGPDILILAGVPQSRRGDPWRRCAWIILCIAAFMFTTFLGPLLIF